MVTTLTRFRNGAGRLVMLFAAQWIPDKLTAREIESGSAVSSLKETSREFRMDRMMDPGRLVSLLLRTEIRFALISGGREVSKLLLSWRSKVREPILDDREVRRLSERYTRDMFPRRAHEAGMSVRLLLVASRMVRPESLPNESGSAVSWLLSMEGSASAAR